MLTNEISTTEKFTRPDKDIDDPFYSEENITRLKKSIEQLKRGQVVTKTLDELRELVYGQTAIH